jgi:hypothetical protein
MIFLVGFASTELEVYRLNGGVRGSAIFILIYRFAHVRVEIE